MPTVVLLTALDLEYQAVRRHLHQPRTQSHPAGTLFETGRLPDAGLVALTVTGEGNVAAAVLTERAIATFQPQALLCAGIAGGIKDDVALGDIVVATKTYAFHSGREHHDGFLARPRAWHASHELEQLARHVARTGSWTRLIPFHQGDRGPALSRPSAVHFKPLISGEVVMTTTSTSLAARLHGNYDDAAAVEMESAGIAQAAHLNRSLPVLIVRGISDMADERKHATDAAGWQYVAAERAAAFTVSVAALAMRGRTGVYPSRNRSAIDLVRGTCLSEIC
jgi:adenosylhomocysteine nucleosidase